LRGGRERPMADLVIIGRMPSMFSPEERRRIELTVAAEDTRSVPKVPGAGEIVQHEDGPVQVMHNGVLIHEGCYHGPWMTEVIRRLRGHHEPQEEAAFHAVVERLATDTPAPVMVELGSFWAYYALWTKRALPNATCFLVEPDPFNLEVGRRNFALNGSEGRFIQGAIGLPDGGVAPLASESDGVLRDTPLITLDGLMEREGLARVDLLLSDVQGAEVDLLAGAARALAERRVRFWVVSTHHHRITGDPLTHQRAWRCCRAPARTSCRSTRSSSPPVATG
jgi:FkbM family methyltransferase